MIPITNQQQLTLIINELLENILQKIAEETVEYLKRYVDIFWYQTHYPTIYNRTYEMLNSVTHSNIEKVGNRFDVFIYFDASQITSQLLGEGLWNQHMGFDERIFTVGLIDSVEQGNPSPYSPDYAREGIHMFEATDIWLDKEIPKIAKKIFKENGIDVVIS
jgi:hypothetical protein